jgi:type IV secretory pathway TraG/TraD family ATPase VirD4
MWNLQSFSQLRDHFGAEAGEAIIGATRCKVVFGGLADGESVERLSTAIGEERVVVPRRERYSPGAPR